MIYIAAPYSHEDDFVQAYREGVATKYAAKLMAQGKMVFSPLTHCRPLALLENLPHNWEFWKEYNLHFLRSCTELHVITLDGWKESKGVNAEIEAAKELGLVIKYIEAYY